MRNRGKPRTREIAEREVCQIWTTEFEADTIFRKAELHFVGLPVWSRQESFIADAGVQNGTLGAADPLFYAALVRDDSPEGDDVRNTHQLPMLVDRPPQYDVTRPRAIGIRESTLSRASLFTVRVGTDEKVRRDYLVQVPAARGRVIPDIDSIRDDFPAL